MYLKFIIYVCDSIACRDLGTYRSETRCTCVDNNRNPPCQRQQIFTGGMENVDLITNDLTSCNAAFQKGRGGGFTFEINFKMIFC